MDKRLCDMTLEEILRPEGHDCSCGKHHACELKYMKVGKGVLACLPEGMAAIGVKKPFVVMDANTKKAAGDRVEALLRQAGIPYTAFVFPGEGRMEPDEHAVGSLIMAFDPGCDVLLAVGSGVINDCCKVAAKACRLPSMVVCTAPSMDGYASNSSSMIQNRVKVSLYNGCPQVIIADTDILKTAPDIMLRAGLGDMLAKYVSVCEWRISHLVYGDPYCEEIAGLVRASLKKIVAHADGLMRREDEALAAVVEGLVLSGVSMAFAQISRPASGLEHYFSHLWEMQALRGNIPSDLHGIQVGVGTLLTLWIYENILNMDAVDVEKARRAMTDFSQEQWTERARRIFGGIAPEILALEEKARKNDPARHEKRLRIIAQKWPEIRRIIEEELPSRESILRLMKDCGLPLTPADLKLSAQDTVDALLGSRDIRDKYLTSSLLWDLGMLEETAEKLRAVCE
ncbi:MAG: sn-glycerol-1-phosphate dehydrogenase [Clostridiales bacterium]|nr:sn-glycerol-1-phosphate dehydrogenase [Clostridiales bacterium]